MRLRFIGLGDVGEQAMESCCRYLQQRGLNRFVERRLILKTTTGQFSLAAVALNGLAGIGRHTPQERLEVRRALGYVFFGGEIRDDAVAIRARHIFKPDRAPDEERSALRRLQSVLKGMGGRAEENFGRIFNNHLKNQCAAIAGQSDWLAADDLLVPDQPLLNPALCPQKGVIGRELGEAFLQDHRRRWRLLDGLGQSGSRLDVVVVAFPLNNSFGGEGAEVLAKAIRRVLDYPEANRIVAILGYGLYDATSTLAGKYLGPYMRALHHLNGFDGLMARPNSADAGMQLGRVLASIALSSDPETIQIDNPDSNQIQRDFGRRLVSFGYAEAPAEGGPPAAPDAGGPLIALYHTALADWIGNHCLNLNGHPMQTALMNRWAENPPSWPANAPPPMGSDHAPSRECRSVGARDRLQSGCLRRRR